MTPKTLKLLNVQNLLWGSLNMSQMSDGEKKKLNMFKQIHQGPPAPHWFEYVWGKHRLSKPMFQSFEPTLSLRPNPLPQSLQPSMTCNISVVKHGETLPDMSCLHYVWTCMGHVGHRHGAYQGIVGMPWCSGLDLGCRCECGELASLLLFEYL